MHRYTIAVIYWNKGDGIGSEICTSLKELGHNPKPFLLDDPIPADAEIVFSFAPYGNFINLSTKIARITNQNRPRFVHWDTEGIPNPKIPPIVTKSLGNLKSWIERPLEPNHGIKSKIYELFGTKPFSKIKQFGFRFRLDGDYRYVYRQGWLNLFVETSQIYAKVNTDRNLPTLYVPWGTAYNWYEDLNLDRDIDVLWMGTRRTKKRIEFVDGLRQKLEGRGYRIHIADGEENPYIYGHERNLYFNRSKLTVNILPAWYFNSFAFRFHLAAGNRCPVISQPILPHCPDYIPNHHYIETPLASFFDQIIYYLEHKSEREQIAENAYQLVTTKMTFTNSIQRILEALENGFDGGSGNTPFQIDSDRKNKPVRLSPEDRA